MEIPKPIIDRIIYSKWSLFAKSIGINSSESKNDCINKIQNALSENALSENDSLKNSLLEFIANEISRGKNRFMQVSFFSPSKKIILQNVTEIQNTILSLQGNLSSPKDFFDARKPAFNDLNIDNPILVYSKIDYKNSSTIPDKISLCFKEHYKIDSFIHNGIRINGSIETDFIWCEIHISKETVIVKSKDETTSNKKTRNAEIICDKYQRIIFEKFDLGEMLSVGEINNTLYNIYKEFTDTAEREFKDIVDPLKDEISIFTNQISEHLNLMSPEYPLNIPLRIQRLFERSLIQQNFDKYTTFFEGKKGIVTRLFFSDESGATVNARSGDQSREGIAVADIYFDTRETIDEIKALEIIWVTWFVQRNNTLISDVKTKIFVSDRNFVVHFLYGYVSEEEENYVFSNIEEFRKQIQTQQ